MNFCDPQSVGLEPTLPEGIWFLVRRLNHSATTASTDTWKKYDKYIGILYILKWKFWILFNLITEANSSIVSIVIHCAEWIVNYWKFMFLYFLHLKKYYFHL